MKWVALAFLAIGLVLMATAVKMNATSKFEDGSFMIQIAAAVAGAGCIAVSLLCFTALAFLAL